MRHTRRTYRDLTQNLVWILRKNTNHNYEYGAMNLDLKYMETNRASKDNKIDEKCLLFSRGCLLYLTASSHTFSLGCFSERWSLKCRFAVWSHMKHMNIKEWKSSPWQKKLNKIHNLEQNLCKNTHLSWVGKDVFNFVHARVCSIEIPRWWAVERRKNVT